MQRKHLTKQQRADLFDDHKGICHRCGQKIQVSEQWHVGHVIDLAIGGPDTIENMRPEHKTCNLGYAAAVGNALAAKCKRVRQRHLGIKKPSRLAEQWAWFKQLRAERANKPPRAWGMRSKDERDPHERG